MMLRRIIAVICVVLAALLILPFLFFRTITNTYLNPDFYAGPILDESYDQMVSFISREVIEEEKVSEYFSMDEVENLIKKHFPKETLGIILDDFVSQLKGSDVRRKQDVITVSLAPIKNNIDLLAGDVSTRIVADIPSCSEDVDLQNIPRDSAGTPTCIPVTVNSEQIRTSLENELTREMNNLIPGEFSINLTAGIDEGKAYISQAVSVIEYTQMILPLIILILFLFIFLIIYKPYSTIISYIGTALFSGGLLSLISVQLMKQIPNIAVTEQTMPGLLEQELYEVRSLYEILISFVSNRMLTYSLYFIGLGVIFILIALYIKHSYGESGRIA